MDINTNTPKVNKNDLLNAVLNKLKLQFGRIEAGFFVGTKYKNGKDVTEVAKKNDKGIGVPERPFMIPAGNKAANKTINITVQSIAGGMDEQQALSRAGIMFKNAIQREITNLKERKLAVKSINALLEYLNETQMTSLEHINTITLYNI